MRRPPVVALALILAAVFFLPAPGAAADRSPAAAAQASRVDSLFRAWDRRDSPGCALAVVREGRVVRARGYGMASLEHGIPITPETVFDIGSAAKQFTAASIVLLARDGRLTLDDPIRRYVPELPEAAAPVTLRQLLHHASGLRDYTDLLTLAGARTADVTTAAEALEMLSRQRGVDFPAGTRYSYCNSGYFLLSVVVQRVAGKSLRDFARERIFSPLKMSRTQFVDDHRLIVPGRATGYARAKQGFRLATSAWEQNGDGGLQTTVGDLVRWMGNFENPVVGGRELIAEMTRPGALADGRPLDYALGLRVDADEGIARIRHGGSWAGFKAEFLRYPEKDLGVVVLCNIREAAPSRLARAAAAVYLPELVRPAKPPAETAAPAPASAVRAFEGLYWNPERFETRRVSVENGQAWYRTGESEKGGPLLSSGRGRLRVAGSSIEISLENQGLGAGGRKTLTETSPDEPAQVWTSMASLTAPPQAAALIPLSGAYVSDELDATYRLAAADGRLVLRRRGAEPVALEPVFENAFEARDLGVILFEKDPAGRVSGFRLGVGGSALFFSRTVR